MKYLNNPLTFALFALLSVLLTAFVGCGRAKSPVPPEPAHVETTPAKPPAPRPEATPPALPFVPAPAEPPPIEHDGHG